MLASSMVHHMSGEHVYTTAGSTISTGTSIKHKLIQHHTSSPALMA